MRVTHPPPGGRVNHRKPLARLGKKKLEQLGDGPRPRSTAKSSGRPRAVNAKRKAKEFCRTYGSVERVKWFQAQPCVACGWPESQNAHVKTGGMGRKADANLIVPLCGPRTEPWPTVGCHALYDLYRSAFEFRFPHLESNLLEIAARLAARYREEQGE